MVAGTDPLWDDTVTAGRLTFALMKGSLALHAGKAVLPTTAMLRIRGVALQNPVNCVMQVTHVYLLDVPKRREDLQSMLRLLQDGANDLTRDERELIEFAIRSVQVTRIAA